MAYTAPGIDSAGIHVPEYADILDRLIASFRNIFGDDLYMGEDTQDYQMCAEFADLMDDIGSVLAEVYASRNPDLASGLSLDYLLPLNGLRRLTATYSTATVTVTGTEGTVIPAGSAVMDANGNQWLTDTAATIPAPGSGEDYGHTDVGVTAEKAGHISADIGGINKIMSPTAGWISATNAAAATAGRDVETDAEVRERRASAVSLNSMAIVEGISGYLRTLDGVKKVRVYENDTASTDANSIPAHSICAVVLGGDADDIAKTIFAKKAPGCGTYGNQTKTVTDIYDASNTVKFSRPDDTAVSVRMTLKTFSGFPEETKDTIKKNIQSYIDGLQIGETLNVGILWSCVLAVNTDMAKPICTPVSVEAKLSSAGSWETSEVTVGYDDVMTCALADITITVQT